MRHLKAGRKLGRNSSHREAMFRNMVTSLMVHGRIQTTQAKAKELRRYAERVITLGKRVPPSTLEGLDGEQLKQAQAKRIHAIRQARHWVRDAEALNRVFTEYAERYKDRPGGYTRVLKMGFRVGDNAPMALIELVTEDYAPKADKPKDEAAQAAPEAAEQPAAAVEEAPEEEPAAEAAPEEEPAADEPAEEPAAEEDEGEDK